MNESKKESSGEKKELEIVKAAKGFMYGFAVHGMVTYALRVRMHMENLFMLITMGDMLGFPILPPYYSLRLLPYAVPQLRAWRQTLLRERDITDAIY